MKKFLKIVIIALLLFGAYKGIRAFIEYKIAWKIVITEESVNIREQATVYSNKLGEAKRNDVFVVKEKVLENKYVWYKIVLKNDKEHKYGWISSERKYPYVKEYNAKKASSKEEVVSDNAKPVIKYKEDIYYTKDINTINYDHLTVTDDSEYKITSEVYKETCPGYHQYWIVYTATDKYDNKATKTQAIIFEQEPSDDDVKNLADIRSSVCTGQQKTNPTD